MTKYPGKVCISMWLDPEIVESLDIRARLNHHSRSAEIREAIMRHINPSVEKPSWEVALENWIKNTKKNI